MSADLLTPFLQALREVELLSPAQWKKLDAELAQFPTVPALARELVRCGWITQYQANLLNRGRARDLVIGQYLLLDNLGGGGMGQVFKARHRHLGRVEALKVIRDDLLADPELARQIKARFQRELQAAASLAHPNIVKVHYADEDHGCWFMVMEYLEGTDLDKLVRAQGPLPVGQACAYAAQAAEGLRHLHERGMVHRDVKPRNLLVTADDQVKILDLGLVLLREARDQQATVDELTSPGGVMGTRLYMAPEQRADAHAVDIRADLYSLGCTLHFLLTGQAPALAGTGRHAPLEELRPEVPAALAAVVRKLTAPRPDDRYQTPAELLVALAAFANAGKPVAMPVAVAVAAAEAVAVPVPESGPAAASGSYTTVLPSAAREETVSDRRTRPGCRVRFVFIVAAGLLFVCLAGGLMYVYFLRAPSGGGTLQPFAGPHVPRGTAKMVPTPVPPEPAGALGETRLLTKHTAPILSVAFLPSGDRALTCSHQEVLLWDLKAGTVLKRYSPSDLGGFGEPPGPDDPRPALTDPQRWQEAMVERASIVSLAVSPDGRRALFGGMDHLVLWDLDKWKKVRAVGKSAGGVLQGYVAFSPAGRYALHVNQSNIVQIWDVDELKELNVSFPGHVACFSPDGSQVLAGQSNPSALEKAGLHLEAVTTQKRLALFGEHRYGVVAVAIAPDGHQALSAGARENDVLLWDLDERKEIGRLTGHTKPVRSVAFSPDGRRALSGSEDRTVRLWDVEQRKEVSVCDQHTGAVNAVAFSPGGNYALSGSEDHTVGVWQLPR